MEIIVLPYMAISFAIAWAIFSPFTQIDGLDEWSFARVETSDLFAIFLPISGLLALFSWSFPVEKVSFFWFASIATVIVLFSLSGFVAGLFVLAKIDRVTTAKRVAIIGVILPFGSFLVLAWVALPLSALAGWVLFALFASIAFASATWALRCLSEWVAGCSANTVTTR